MIDLIGTGIVLTNPSPGYEYREIPSRAFSVACAETARTWDAAADGPLPPP